MKAGEARVTSEEMMEHLEKLGRRGWRDPDLLKYTVGEDKPARNVLRPVGMIESCRSHYIMDYVGQSDDLPRVPVCTGDTKCPICRVVKHLYSVGTEESKKRANRLRSSERNYWNVIPRWEYDWGDEEPQCKVLAFGITARRELADIVADYGNPGDPDDGFDIVYEVQKQTEYGNKYSFAPLKIRTRKGKRVVEEVVYNTLTEEESEYEIVDLSKFTTPPESDVLRMIEELFFEADSGDRRRRDVGEDEDEEEDVEDDDAEDDDENLCFGDPASFEEDSKTCVSCDEYKECRGAIRKSRMKSGRK